jgi:hypothetical protein
MTAALSVLSPKTGWQDKFINALAECPSVKAAATRAGVSRQLAYRERQLDPEFAERWVDAIGSAIDLLEQAAYERAITVSDTLAIFLLKSHRPEIYRETTRNEVDITVSDATTPAALIAARIDELAARRNQALDVESVG